MAKSKFFRIATEGATTDGRVIQRSWLEQMAKNYSPELYGARVNLEHFKGIMPDGPFKAYGDVIALKTEENNGKLRLLAQLDPTDDLITLNKKRQKVFCSMEIDPEFADTGECYLVGLAVTDSPASLGTEMLKFSATAETNPLAERKQKADNLFSEAVEFTLELEEEAAPKASDEGKSLLSKVKQLLTKKSGSDDKRFEDISAAVEAVAESQRTALDALNALPDTPSAAEFGKLKTAHEALQNKFNDLLKKLETEQDPKQPSRPHATGGSGEEVTDC